MLEQKAIARDTLVIVTADHGESLGEREQNGHGNSVYQGEDNGASARTVFITKFTYPDHLEAPAFSQAEMYGVVEGHWKLIVRQGAGQGTPRVELYDLSTDPHETDDLGEVERGRTQALRRKLAEFLAQQQTARWSCIDDHTSDSVSASTARDTLEGAWDHLRGLGYIR